MGNILRMSKWRKERKGINEIENEKKNFSLCTDAPLPSEKIWGREKQKQTIYGNQERNVYRNTILRRGFTDVSIRLIFLFSRGDVFLQAGRIYEEISEICFK